MDPRCICVDLTTNSLTFNGVTLKLTPRAAEIAYVLAEEKPKTVSYGMLLRRIYGVKEHEFSLKGIQEQVCDLRKRLKPLGLDLICSNEGYRLTEIPYEETYA